MKKPDILEKLKRNKLHAQKAAEESNIIEKAGSFIPAIFSVLLVGCILVSLCDYEVPAYEIIDAEAFTEEINQTEAALTDEEGTQASSESKSGTEKTDTDTDAAAVGAVRTTAAAQGDGEDQAVFNLANIADGVYEGEGTGFAGKIRVSVEVKDHKIVSITVLSVEADDTSFVEQAKGVIAKIIAAQSVDVDTVSGATYSSRGIIRAVKNALTGEEDDGQAAAAAGSIGVGAGTTSLPAVTEPTGYKDGVYEGTGTGFAGEIKVQVTISKGKIKKIEIVRIADGTDYVEKASAVIESIIKNQSTNVDTVSGATYSSVGIIAAVRDALSKAAVDSTETSETEEDNTGKFPYDDGVYYGTAAGFSGDITVAVALSDKTIQAIVVTESVEDDSYLSRAKTVLDRIMKKQSTKVDTVSGATYSSSGLLNAVKNALKEAKRITAGEETGSTETDSSGVTGTIPYNEGVYYGTGYGYSGDITVAVAIADHTIKAIVVTESQDDAEFFSRARTLIDAVMKQQNTDVDTVSGATFSSEGLLEAIDNALLAAKNATEGNSDSTGTNDTESTENSGSQSTESGGTDNTESGGSTENGSTENQDTDSTEDTQGGGTVYQDGAYTVTVTCEPDKSYDFDSYQITAVVTVKDDKIISITDITADDGGSNTAYINRAANGTSKKAGVVAQIVAKGNADGIDTISSATCSSNALIQLCRQALENAKK